MDVFESDSRPAETEASEKFINGHATSEDGSVVAVACVAGRRKKAKRKNRSKNSQSEPGVEPVTATSISLDTVLLVKPLKAEPAAQEIAYRDTRNVNSNSSNSSSHSSSHSNGLPDDELTTVDAISKKLAQCVLIGRNGLTNGLPKHEVNKVDDSPSAADRSHDTSAGTGMSSPQNYDKGATGRKKHRSRQAKKTQSNPSFTINGIGKDRRGDIVQTQDGIGSSPGVDEEGVSAASLTSTSVTTSPFPLPESEEAKQRTNADAADPTPVEITYEVYESERQMPAIMALIQKDLSEPYSIYTYRYFIHNWPKLCFLALHQGTYVGAIVCKLDIHRQDTRRGYIAMLAVDKDYRKLKIGTTLVQKAIQVMLEDKADEVVLETEITNQPALRLYENLGFVRDKRLFHYYLNGVDALRLKLWFR
ncbi:N-alpha-acetyltransferase 30A [Anopheles nili]|uniref:N-alpha-acetyltransferase 30A n=1 Tax=Anopheles nili TaxID=185578 RepID=UPI00237C0D22|nr:N-alpha-acetyltransferase 30A [Anopheles nili]